MNISATVLGWSLAAAPAAVDRARVPTGDVVAEPRTYEAVRAIDPIVIDGRATEKTWQIAPVDDRMVERQPFLGQKPPVRTTIRVAYDDLALYVFIDAEADPGDVIVRTLRRDNGGIYNDDTITVKIDPTNNNRDGYALGVNADGAQIDSLGLDDGKQYVTEWDGVWSAETVRRTDGYTVEYRIPFAILGIKSAEERTIGFNITRDHPSRNATYDWALIVPPRSPMAASQFGDLTGLRNIQAQRAIEFTPYMLLRTDLEPRWTLDPRRRPNYAAGGDLRVQIGAGSYVEASLLTDFAQVEADEVQVARDRFPLFFPERRPFFINGLDVFNFGRQGEAQLFFSRRVGLDNGQPIPIAGGLKVYGRAGPISYGLLEVQTLGTPGDPARGLSPAKPENVAVARIRAQVTRSLAVGMMALGRHRFETADNDDASGGVDVGLVALDGRLQGYGFVAGTWAEEPATASVYAEDEQTGERTLVDPARRADQEVGSSAHAQLEYRGLYVRPGVMWLWSDRDFRPALGFYRRPGSSRQEVYLDFAPRPRFLGLREIVFGPSYSVEADPGYTRMLGQSGGGRLQFNWNNGAGVGYEIFHFIDHVQEPFELYLHQVEAQRYTGFRQRASASLPERRTITGGVSYEAIELFGGFAHQPSANLTARLGKHFTLGGGYTHLVGHLQDPGENFDFGFANGNLDIAFTRNLALDNLGRLDLSPGRQRVGVQSRLRWRFLPGSDLFLVYRNDIPLGTDPPDLPPRTDFHEITLKLTYYLRAFSGR